MSPRVASALFGIGIATLFFLDRDRDSRTSPAVWIAVAWVSIGASRMVSEWLSAVPAASPEQYLEGSPLDQLILTGLLAAALIVLVRRGERSGTLLRANGPLLLFFLYCAVSCLWSDYPFVALKRWTKALGNVMMVLVVLTDPNPSSAIKRLLAWTGFLLIPLSVLFIKYYPELGRGYLEWEWTPVYVGVAGSKNGLGFICLVFGLGALWRLIETLGDKDGSHRVRQTVVHGIVLAMALWLFHMADSSTSLGCFLLGGLLIVTVTLLGRRPANVHFILGAMVSVALLAFVYRDAYTYAIEAMGRDTTLTGRADLWDDILGLVVHPWFGTGFESFFLGDRLKVLWNKYWWHPNEAHNGYLEVYLTLGWIGVGLLVVQIVSGYRNVVDAFRRTPGLGTLRLALLAAALLYNMSEAAFKVMHPVWIAFLLAVTATPELPGLQDGGDPQTRLVPSTTSLPGTQAGSRPPRCPVSRTSPTPIVARGRPDAP